MASEPSITNGYWDKVVVSNVEGVKSFTLKLSGSENEFLSLMRDIQVACSSSSAKPGNVAVGSIVLAKFSFDQQWYRAQIRDVKEDGQVFVVYVDYGNSETVSQSDLREANSKFLSLPIQGVTCQLDRIDYTTDIAHQYEDVFRSLCLNQAFTAQFVRYLNSDEKWVVELYHPTGSVNDWFGNQTGKLQSKAGHVSVPGRLPHPHNAGLKGKEQTINGMNGNASRGGSGASTPLGQSPSRPVAARRQNVPAQFSGLVVYSKGPQQFWLQMDDEADAVIDITNKVVEYCQSRDAKKASRPKVGQLVAALYSVDNSWYRATVLEVKGESLQVYFIDYGNEEEVAMQDVAILPQNLITQPGYAIEASLADIEPADGSNKFSHDAAVLFSDTAMASACQVTVVGDLTDYPLKVSITCDGKPLHTQLIEAGLAKQSSASAKSTPSRPGTGTTTPCVMSPGMRQGQAVNVICVFSISPTEFYVQNVETQGALEDLMADIAAKYPGDVPLKSSPSVGSPCCALYSADGGWYRAVIQSFSGANAKVFFVDYGNTEEVPLGSIRQLPVDLQQLPSQAIKCSLSIPTSAQIGPDVSGKFNDLVMSEEASSMTITVRDKITDCHIVTLRIGARDIAKELFEDTTQSDSVKVSPLKHRQGGQSNVPSHSPSVSSQSGYARQSVESGQREQVFVSWLIHPGAFWVQKAGCEDQLEGLFGLAKECSEQSQVMSSPQPGFTCVAKYPADDQWYRAEIVGPSGPSAFSVLFVDYGNTEVVPATSIYMATPSLLETPALAFKCSLLGVKPVSGSEWSKESHDIMESLLADGCYCTFLAKHNDSYLVEVVYGDDESLHDKLVKSNVAKSGSKDSQASDMSHGSQRSGSSSSSRPKSVRSVPDSTVLAKPRSSPAPVHKVDAAGDRTADSCKVAGASLSALGLKVGDLITISVVHMESVEQVYGQCHNHKAMLDTLYDTMSQYYHSGKGQNVDRPVIDSCYIVQFQQDDEWYRAKVLSVHDDSVEVFYLDYGNCEKTTISRMRQLTPDFTKLPAQALCFSINGVTKQSVKEADYEKFSKEYIFAELTAKLVEDKNTHVVADLFNGETNIADILGPTDDQSMASTSEADPALFFPERMIGEDDFKGFLTHVETQESFFLHRADDVEVINDTLANVIEEVGTNPSLPYVQLDQACLAKYTQDEAWYRARVICTTSDQCKVMFVDYGNEDTVEAGSLLQISEALAQVPPLAVHCRLKTSIPDMDLLKWAGEEELNVKVHSVDESIATVSITNSLGEAFARLSLSTSDASLPQQSPTKPPVAASPSRPTASVSQSSTPSRAATATSPPRAVTTQPLPSPSITQGQHEAWLSHAEDGGILYLQLNADSDKLTQLTEELQKAGDNAEPEVYCPVGHACLTQFSEDNAWYRAVVMEECKDGRTAIRFADFGNAEVVPNSKIKVLPKNLCTQPPISLRCKVSSGALATMPIDKIIESLQGKLLTAEFKTVEEPYDIELIGDDIAELVVDSKESTGDTPEQIDSPDPLHVRYEETTLVINDDLQPVVVCHAENPSHFYCQFSLDDVEKVSQLLYDTYTNNHEKYTMPADKVKCGVACVAQYSVDKQWYRAVISDQDSDSANSVQMADWVLETESATFSSQLVKDSGRLVFFVDFGNTDTVELSHICRLTTEISQIPIQATRCSLSGIFPLSGNLWDEDAMSRFSELIETDLTAKIVKVIESDGHSKKAIVSLYTSTESVADSLVNSALGSKIPTSGVPTPEFCAKLCKGVVTQLKSSPEYESTIYLSDQLNLFVEQLTPSLHSQLDDMCQSDEGPCTAQDIVSHVSYKILSSLLHQPFTRQLNLFVSNKELISVEVQTIVGELLEEVMRVNTALIDQMCDEGLNTLDNMSTDPESVPINGNGDKEVSNDQAQNSYVTPDPLSIADNTDHILHLTLKAKQLATSQLSALAETFYPTNTMYTPISPERVSVIPPDKYPAKHLDRKSLLEQEDIAEDLVASHGSNVFVNDTPLKIEFVEPVCLENDDEETRLCRLAREEFLENTLDQQFDNHEDQYVPSCQAGDFPIVDSDDDDHLVEKIEIVTVVKETVDFENQSSEVHLRSSREMFLKEDDQRKEPIAISTDQSRSSVINEELLSHVSMLDSSQCEMANSSIINLDDEEAKDDMISQLQNQDLTTTMFLSSNDDSEETRELFREDTSGELVSEAVMQDLSEDKLLAMQISDEKCIESETIIIPDFSTIPTSEDAEISHVLNKEQLDASLKVEKFITNSDVAEVCGERDPALYEENQHSAEDMCESLITTVSNDLAAASISQSDDEHESIEEPTTSSIKFEENQKSVVAEETTDIQEARPMHHDLKLDESGEAPASTCLENEDDLCQDHVEFAGDTTVNVEIIHEEGLADESESAKTEQVISSGDAVLFPEGSIARPTDTLHAASLRSDCVRLEGEDQATGPPAELEKADHSVKIQVQPDNEQDYTTKKPEAKGDSVACDTIRDTTVADAAVDECVNSEERLNVREALQEMEESTLDEANNNVETDDGVVDDEDRELSEHDAFVSNEAIEAPSNKSISDIEDTDVIPASNDTAAMSTETRLLELNMEPCHSVMVEACEMNGSIGGSDQETEYMNGCPSTEDPPPNSYMEPVYEEESLPPPLVLVSEDNESAMPQLSSVCEIRMGSVQALPSIPEECDAGTSH